MFQNAFRNVTCERPPRPRPFGTGPFLDGAATPPWQGGEYARIVQSVRIPLLVSLVRRGGCGITKKSRSHRSAADGVVAHTQCFKTHSETSLASDHPVRAFSERDHFLMARPRLLCNASGPIGQVSWQGTRKSGCVNN